MGTNSSASMDVETQGSEIHKRGVYALRSFCAGDVVLRWNTSQRVSREQAITCAQDPDTYLHPLDANEFFQVQSPECFVNHSCENNTVVRDFMDVAIRDIQPGEEITSNYETDGAGLSFTCHCGSPHCRGVIGKTTSDKSQAHA